MPEPRTPPALHPFRDLRLVTMPEALYTVATFDHPAWLAFVYDLTTGRYHLAYEDGSAALAAGPLLFATAWAACSAHLADRLPHLYKRGRDPIPGLAEVLQIATASGLSLTQPPLTWRAGHLHVLTPTEPTAAPPGPATCPADLRPLPSTRAAPPRPRTRPLSTPPGTPPPTTVAFLRTGTAANDLVHSFEQPAADPDAADALVAANDAE